MRKNHPSIRQFSMRPPPISTCLSTAETMTKRHHHPMTRARAAHTPPPPHAARHLREVHRVPSGSSPQSKGLWGNRQHEANPSSPRRKGGHESRDSEHRTSGEEAKMSTTSDSVTTEQMFWANNSKHNNSPNNNNNNFADVFRMPL